MAETSSLWLSSVHAQRASSALLKQSKWGNPGGVSGAGKRARHQLRTAGRNWDLSA